MNILSRFAEFWRKLTGSQKAALSFTFLMFGIFIAIAVSIASSTAYTTLYANLNADDAAAVVTKLKEMKVPYRIENGGGISVPESNRNELLLTLAGEGIPRSGGEGFELFDKAQLGQSEFGEHLNYIRALQGELAKTISGLDSVRNVRVHLVIPERRLFETQDNTPTASVVLNLKGAAPGQHEIRAVIHLVSTAVEGLKPENVTVVDTTGHLLSEMVTGATGDLDTRLQDQRTVETQLDTRLQAMLDRTLGPDKSLVNVSVKLNYDKRHVDLETYSPVNNGTATGTTTGTTTGPDHGVLDSQTSTVETYGGKTAPGVAAPTSPNGSNYNRSESTVHYDVSKQTEHVDYSPGKIDRVNVALFLDKSVPADQMSRLQDTVAAAAGTTRDLVQVQTLAFDTTAAQAADAEKKKIEGDQRWAMWLRIGIPVVLIVVFFVIVLVLFRRATQATPAEFVNAENGAYPMLTGPAKAIGQYAATGALGSTPPDPEMTEMLSQMDPQRLAQVIKGLLSEEKSS